MAKTLFVEVAPPNEQQSTIVTDDFMNSIYYTNGGHKHDGGANDGSAAKLDINHVNNLDIQHNADGTHGDITAHSIVATRETGTSGVFLGKVTGDAVARYTVRANGERAIGSGAISQDIRERRTGAKALEYDDDNGGAITMKVIGNWIAQRTSSALRAFSVWVAGDTTPRVELKTDSSIVLGNGTTQDIRIKKSGVLLEFDDNAGGAVPVKFIGTSDNIYHGETTKARGFPAPAIQSSMTNGLLVTSQSEWAVPQSADGVQDWGHIFLDIPNGCVITHIDLRGYTGVSDGEITAILQEQNLLTFGFSDIGTTITVNGGDTIGSQDYSDTKMSTYGYFILLSAKASTDVLNAKIQSIVVFYTSLRLSETI